MSLLLVGAVKFRAAGGGKGQTPSDSAAPSQHGASGGPVKGHDSSSAAVFSIIFASFASTKGFLTTRDI